MEKMSIKTKQGMCIIMGFPKHDGRKSLTAKE